MQAPLMHINIRGKEVKKAAHSCLILCSFRSGGGRMGQVVSGDQNSHPKSASTVIIHTHTHRHRFVQQAFVGKLASACAQHSSTMCVTQREVSLKSDAGPLRCKCSSC
jgi:hypothetical protein